MKFPYSFLFQRPPRPQRVRRRAVVTVEVALCMIFVLLPVTLGGFQFALVFMTQHSLQQVARESARFAAVRYNEETFDMDENQGNTAGQDRSLKNVIRAQAAANGIAWDNINGLARDQSTGKLLPADLQGKITITPAPAERISGQPLTVTITYPMKRRALLGSLFFAKEVVIDGKKTRQIDLPRLGFLQNHFSASSTTLLE